MRHLIAIALLLVVVACGDSEPVALDSSDPMVASSPGHCPPGHERRGLCTPEPDPEPDPEPEPPADSVPDSPVDPEPEPMPPPTIAASPQLAWGAPYPVDGPYPLLALWDAVEGVDGYRVTYGPEGGEVDTEDPYFQASVPVEVGWLCVRTYWGDPLTLSDQRCNAYPSTEPHNKLQFIHNSLADSLFLKHEEVDRFVVVRWWDAEPTVPVILPSGDRGWIEVEQVTNGEAYALRTVPGGIWRPDEGAIINLTPESHPEVATISYILYTLTADPALGPVIVVEWGDGAGDTAGTTALRSG